MNDNIGMVWSHCRVDFALLSPSIYQHWKDTCLIVTLGRMQEADSPCVRYAVYWSIFQVADVISKNALMEMWFVTVAIEAIVPKVVENIEELVIFRWHSSLIELVNLLSINFCWLAWNCATLLQFTPLMGYDVCCIYKLHKTCTVIVDFEYNSFSQ